MGFSFAFIVFLMGQSCEAIKNHAKKTGHAMVEEQGQLEDAGESLTNTNQDPGIDDEDIPAGTAFSVQKVARIDDSDSDGSSSLFWLLCAAAAAGGWWAKNNPEKAKDAMGKAKEALAQFEAKDAMAKAKVVAADAAGKAQLVAADAAGKALDLPIVQQALAAFGIESSRLDFLRTTKEVFTVSHVDMAPEAPQEEFTPLDVPLVQETSFAAEFSDAPLVTPEAVGVPPMDLLDGMDSTPLETKAAPMDLMDDMDSMSLATKAEEPMLLF